MKKNYLTGSSYGRINKKWGRIMRLTFLLMVGFIFSVSAKSYSQTTRLNIDLKNQTITDVIEHVEENSEFVFLYKNEDLDLSKKVTINLKNATIDKILDAAFKEQSIDYDVYERQIVLRKAEETNSLALPTQQQRTVTGVVTDQSGQPLPGVTVMVQGTTTGTVTNDDGEFSLTVPDDAEILQFSFVGMKTKEVSVEGRTTITVVMEEETIGIEEVIAVGYGTQKLVDVIGSVSTVKTEDLKTVATPTIAQSMMGRTSGVYVKTKNAQPGDYSGMSYNIRGFGEPLLIIDGMPATNEEFLLLDPNDIDELNVLKDAATAAEYGARAGNGVILVTTKRGKVQEPQFSYNANYGVQKATMVPGMINSWENAQYENIAQQNAGIEKVTWSMDDINKFLAGDDPLHYPNTDWWEETLRTFAPQTQHNLSIRGGTERIKYFVSGGYYYQESLLRSNDIKNKKYNLRSNIDIALTDKLDLGLDIMLLENDYIGPSWDMRRTEHLGVMMLLYRSRPQYPVEYPDPTKYSAMGNDDLNPVSASKIDHVGYKKWNKFTSDVKFNLSYKLPYGFNVKANFNYKRLFQNDKRKEYLARAYWFDYDENGEIVYHNHRNFNNYDWLYQQNTVSYAMNQQYYLTWNRTFGEHDISSHAVFEHLSSNGEWFDAQRIRYEFDIDYLFAGPDLDKSNNGRGWQDGRIGQVFSLDYNYKEKYLLGFNMRRDGSPRFPSDTRWGTFPSISAGWRISEEDFVKNNLQFVNNLKLRASWGKLGYDDTGYYQYLATYSIRPSLVMIDGEVNSGINADDIPNPNITWETMITSNIGLDFGMLDNKFRGSVDVYHRLRSDVLGTRQVSLPGIVGASLPPENIEEYSNRGIDFSLDYNIRVNAVQFEIGGNISYTRERIEFVDQPVYGSEEERRRRDRVGQWADTEWGYKSDGVFTSQEEIDNWAIIDGRNNATVNVGDIKLIDYNEDGIINNNDHVIIGSGNFPDLTYGIYSSISWKGLNFNMLWQGAGLYDVHYGKSADLRIPFAGGNAPIAQMVEYGYIPENEWGLPANTDQYPLWPRVYWPGYSTHNTWSNSRFWYVDGSYIRLKNIELGYTLPKHIVNRVGIDNLKIYFTGYNVLTFSELDFYDPELQSDNNGDWARALEYPPTSNYSFGMILDF